MRVLSAAFLLAAFAWCLRDQARVIRATPVEPWPAADPWDDTTGCGEYLPRTVPEALILARCRACGAC